MKHLVVIGCDEIVNSKHMTCIAAAIHDRRISGYSIVDLNREKDAILKRVAGHGV